MEKEKKQKNLETSEDNGRSKNIQVKKEDILALYGVHSAISLVGVTSVNDRNAIIGNLRVLKRISKELEESFKDIVETLKVKGYDELDKKYKESPDLLSDQELVSYKEQSWKLNEDAKAQKDKMSDEYENITLLTISKSSFDAITGNQCNEKVSPSGFMIFEDFVVKESEENNK